MPRRATYSRDVNDRFTGQRYMTRTAHRTGQPFMGLGTWLMHQDRLWLQHAVDAAQHRGIKT
jgi:hypothetical protein